MNKYFVVPPFHLVNEDDVKAEAEALLLSAMFDVLCLNPRLTQ
jgi:hypothetical protein